jgi:methyltransferase-like protein
MDQSKQTAVEWFMDNLPNRFRNAILNECGEEIEQAKQMEKEQMKDIYIQHVLRPFIFNFEEYYNKTYGTK